MIVNYELRKSQHLLTFDINGERKRISAPDSDMPDDVIMAEAYLQAKKQIETVISPLKIEEFKPPVEFKPDIKLVLDSLVVYDEKLYRVKEAHTAKDVIDTAKCKPVRKEILEAEDELIIRK